MLCVYELSCFVVGTTIIDYFLKISNSKPGLTYKKCTFLSDTQTITHKQWNFDSLQTVNNSFVYFVSKGKQSSTSTFLVPSDSDVTLLTKLVKRPEKLGNRHTLHTMSNGIVCIYGSKVNLVIFKILVWKWPFLFFTPIVYHIESQIYSSLTLCSSHLLVNKDTVKILCK